MVGFYIKKAFFDGWDNLLGIVLVNVSFVALLALGYAAMSLFQIHAALGIIALVLWFVLMHLAAGAVSYYTKEYAWYRRPGFAEFRDCFKEAIPASLVLSAVNLLLVLLTVVIMPFYLSLGSILGTVIFAVLFWVEVMAMGSLMYFLPVSAQLRDRPLKALKKSFIIFLDNAGFSLFLLFYTLVNMILSIVTAMLIPGITAILLSHQDAVKLLMYKYDYLEEQPEGDRKHIPWTALLFDEQEKVGQRSLKGMIFPWKADDRGRDQSTCV